MPARRNRDLDARILSALRRGPMSTKQLADYLGEKFTTVREYCKRLKEEELIKSQGVPGSRRLLFCINHQAVVTGAIYPECDAKKHALRYFYSRRVWQLVL